MKTEGIFLGHHVSKTSIKVDPLKIEVISHISIPTSQKEVNIFLGHAGYYRRLIENFTKIVAPMLKFLTKDVDFLWDANFQNSFQVLNDNLLTSPQLRGPNWSLTFAFLPLH